jgi:hypothetical protein
MPREIIIPHSELQNAQTITQVMDKKFKEQNLNIHMNDVVDLQDDFKKGVRKIEVKNSKVFFMGNVPWKK